MRKRMLPAALASLVLAAAPLEAQGGFQQVDAVGADVEVLRPGDLIRISVWRKPELSGDFQVAADGFIADPFYMAVRVGGVPLTEAAARIRTHLEQYETQPQVMIEPLFRVAVGGEVQRPDLYTFGRSTTVAQAVLLAGGPSPRGDLKRVWLHRDGLRQRIDLSQSLDGLGASPVRSGDYVVVGSERPILREYVLPSLLAVGATASIVRLFVQ